MFEAGRFLQKRAGFGIAQLDAAMDMAIDNAATASGNVTTVNISTALRVSAVWACCSILADDLAAMPLLTFQELRNGGREKATGHYLWSLLQRETNPELTAFRFKQLMQMWICLWGNAYAEIVINGRGQVTELWPWRPDRVRVGRINGQLMYQYRMENGDTIVAPKDRILHLRGIGTDGLMGISPIDQHKRTIGTSLAMTEHGNKFFTNGARPMGVLEHPNKLSDPARKSLADGWEGRHQGINNAYRVAILEEGMKYHDIGCSMVDAQYLDAQNFSVLDICRIYKVQPHRVAQLERSTNNNIEHQGLEYVLYTLGPLTTNWEQELEFSLLSPRERETIGLKFNFRHLIRGDMQAQAAFYGSMITNGILTQNEVREELDLNPLGQRLADIPWKQGAMIPADERPAAIQSGSPLPKTKASEVLTQ
jgi:HK97 family phage portal protein